MLAPFQSTPTIIGTVSTLPELSAFSEREESDTAPCDVLEARLDRIGWESNWLELCSKIEQAGTPVLLTLRLEAEGGAWTGRDTNRLGTLLEAVDTLSAIDLELQSDLVPILTERAESAGKPIVLSHHNFEHVPPDEQLLETIAEMHTHPNAIAKLALMANAQEDVDRLEHLLAEHLTKPEGKPLCLIAMGDDWAQTRIDFPAAGSALTYAYLDTPSAPGQLSCDEVRAALRPS